MFKNLYYKKVTIEQTEREKKKEEEEINNIRNKNGLIDYENLMRKIGFEERNINSELVKKHFHLSSGRCAEKL